MHCVASMVYYSSFYCIRGTLLYGEGQYIQAVESFKKATNFRPSLAGRLQHDISSCSLFYSSCSLKPWLDVVSARTSCRGRRGDAYIMSLQYPYLLHCSPTGVETLCSDGLKDPKAHMTSGTNYTT